MSAGSKGREGRCGQEPDRTWCPAGSAGCSRQYTSPHGCQAQGKQTKTLDIFRCLIESLVSSHFIFPVYATPALSLFALQQVSILPLMGTICSFGCTINLQCLMQDEAERHMIALVLLTAAPTLSLVCCIIFLHSKMAGCQSFRSPSCLLYQCVRGSVLQCSDACARASLAEQSSSSVSKASAAVMCGPCRTNTQRY